MQETMQDTKTFLTVGEVAQRLNRSEARVYQLLARGVLPSCRVGGRILIPNEAWKAWLDGKVAEATAAVGH